LRHDHRAARRALLAMDSADPDAAIVEDLVLGLRELDLGRADRAVPPLERFGRAVRANPDLGRRFRDEHCYLALAYARLGRTRDAFRLLESEPRSPRCAAFRGDVLALSGNWSKAWRAYRDAIGLVPSSPIPLERAGAALLSRDDPEGAARLFRAAVDRSPDWADAHFGLAEAMMQLGRYGEAERHYRAGAKLAPRWGALHVGWGEALWRLGRQEEARKVWAAASGMDLGPVAKARLQQLLAFTSAVHGERAESAQARVSASSADLGRRLVTVTFVPVPVMA
jgi:tetratricopeptide (TPR) repeat protein